MKDEKSVSKIENKLGIIEQELIDVKNKSRQNTRSNLIASGALGGVGMS